MRSCWNEKPEERPSFSELRKIIKAMGRQREVLKCHYDQNFALPFLFTFGN